MPAKKKKVTSAKSKKAKAKAKAKAKKTTAKVKSKKTSKKKVGSKIKAKVTAKTQRKKQTKTKVKSKKKTKGKTAKVTKATKTTLKKTVKTKVKSKPAKATKKIASVKKETEVKPTNQAHVNILEVVEPKRYRVKSSATIVGSLNFVPYRLSKDEEYMNASQLKHFENILTLWKQQLMYEVDSTVGHMKEDVMSYPDPLDRASQEEGFNLELRTRDRERKLIKKIEQALDMIKNGEYGYCEDCGAEIGIRRLEARPTADKCIDCKTYEEIREKQVGGQ